MRIQRRRQPIKKPNFKHGKKSFTPDPYVMLLRAWFKSNYRGRFQKFIGDPDMAEYWKSLSSKEKTYVLKGGER